jgi:N-methylhydantoinase A
MLMADAVRDYSTGVLGRDNPDSLFVALERRASKESPNGTIERSADLRYRGQSYEINVPCPGSLAGSAPRFHREHARLYGYSNPDGEIEVVTLRVHARTVPSKPGLRNVRRAVRRRAQRRRVFVGGSWHNLEVWQRESIGSKTGSKPRSGPALVLDYGSTTLIPPGWTYRLDRRGNLLIQHSAS